MTLVRLIYCSYASPDLSEQDLDAILISARTNNSERDISGVLYYDNHYFLQYLEGTKEQVEETLNRIKSDSRHNDVTVLNFEPIPSKEFKQWSMGYLPSTGLNTAIYLQLLNQTQFDPFKLTPKTSVSLIKEFKQYLI